VDFDLRYTVNRKTLTLDLAVFDEKLLTAAPPRITAEITMPGGEVRRVNFLATKRGRFETTLDEIKPGDYQIQTVYGVTKLPPVGLTLPGELFGETPGMGLDYENLSQLATLSGGAINPDPAALDQRETVTEEFTHLALPLLVLAFTLLLLEAVLRELLPRLIARSKVAVRIPASKNGLRLKKQAR
jgi:hypothetical protein